MNRNQKLVQEFHEAMALGTASHQLRHDMILEEVYEYIDSYTMAEKVDALIDILFLAYGGMLDLGLDAELFFEEVARSNMTKTPGLLSPSGKLSKGPSYQPPRIAELIKAGVGRLKR